MDKNSTLILSTFCITKKRYSSELYSLLAIAVTVYLRTCAPTVLEEVKLIQTKENIRFIFQICCSESLAKLAMASVHCFKCMLSLLKNIQVLAFLMGLSWAIYCCQESCFFIAWLWRSGTASLQRLWLKWKAILLFKWSANLVQFSFTLRSLFWMLYCAVFLAILTKANEYGWFLTELWMFLVCM